MEVSEGRGERGRFCIVHIFLFLRVTKKKIKKKGTSPNELTRSSTVRSHVVWYSVV